MQANPMPGDQPCREEADPGAEDLMWQGRVLSLVLEDPYQLTEREITCELAGEDPEFGQRDAVARAVEKLARSGLVRRCETLILPTKAARHFASLEVE